MSPFYDPLVAKVIAHAHTRAAAIARLQTALEATVIEGIKTNIPFIQKALASAEFQCGNYSTNLVAKLTQKVLA